MAPAWSRGLDKLVGGLGPRVIDNLQKKNKYHLFEKGERVRMGGQVFGLAEQMGMGLGEQVDPHHLVILAAFDCGEDKGKEMFAVKEPASPKDIEDIKDTRVFKRSNPTLRHQPYATRRRHTGRLGGGRACSAAATTR